MKRFWVGMAIGLIVGGCEAAENVEVLPLPALERPTPEARLGLPEIRGTWNFAGWEIARGDSVTLERTFPSFGSLEIQTQRLDSVAGAFALASGPTSVVGDVRRNGAISLVSFAGGVPRSYIAGEFAADTLWLELTSILAPGEWPRDARAAFVRDPVEESIAWIRGARPVDELPVDTISPMADSATTSQSLPPAASPGTDSADGVSNPASSGPGGANGQAPSARPDISGPQPSVSQPPVNAAPSGASSEPPVPDQQPAPATGQPEAEDTEPEPEPEPEVEVPPIPEPDLPSLLGDPIQ